MGLLARRRDHRFVRLWRVHHCGGTVWRSIIGPLCMINSYSLGEDSILFNNVTIGRHANIRRAIIEGNAVVADGEEIQPQEGPAKRLYRHGVGNRCGAEKEEAVPKVNKLTYLMPLKIHGANAPESICR